MCKYMITGIGESEIVLIGNNKNKLKKEAIEIAKSSFEVYIENCKYLGEEPTINFKDFKCFEIEDYNESFIKNYLKGFEVYKI